MIEDSNIESGMCNSQLCGRHVLLGMQRREKRVIKLCVSVVLAMNLTPNLTT